jgi:hypothetical protein
MRKKRTWFLMLLALIIVTGGLVYFGSLSTDPDRFTRRVQHWIPVGTSISDATNIMQRHGFRCDFKPFDAAAWAWFEDFKKQPSYRASDHVEPWRGDVVECYLKSEVRNTMWIAHLQFRDGKLVSYGPPTISGDPLRLFSNMH